MHHLNQIFQVANQQYVTTQVLTQKPIISTLFTIASEGSYINILLILNDTHIFVVQDPKVKMVTHFTKLCFQLKFQVLRDVWLEEKTPGKPIGIKLQLNKKFVQLYSKDQSALHIWIRELQKKINQRNFHKLFSPKRKIGKGAFASVYLAQRLCDKKMVAVKAFSKETQFSAEKGKQSLQNEIKIMRQINHSNLIKLQGVFQTQNSIYIILQNLPGKQLNDYLRTNKKYTETQITQVMRDLLRGLRHLASKGIIHRDLKPENIMFRKQDGTDLVICDFGLATHANTQKYLFVRCGTPGFVAPQIINIRDMSSKSQPISDVFSAGLIFHYLLFGDSIFPGRKYNEVLHQNRICAFNFQNTKYSTIGYSSFDLLSKMLQKDPYKRITAQQALKHPFFQEKMQIQDQDQHNYPHIFGKSNRYQHFDHVQEFAMDQQQSNDLQQQKNDLNLNSPTFENSSSEGNRNTDFSDDNNQNQIKNENGNQYYTNEKEVMKTPSVFNDNQTKRNGFGKLALRKKTSFYANNQIFHSNSTKHKQNCSPKLKKDQKSNSRLATKSRKISMKKEEQYI